MEKKYKKLKRLVTCKKNGNSSKKNQKPCKINSYRRWKTVTGIKMGTFVKKNKLNTSSK